MLPLRPGLLRHVHFPDFEAGRAGTAPEDVQGCDDVQRQPDGRLCCGRQLNDERDQHQRQLHERDKPEVWVIPDRNGRRNDGDNAAGLFRILLLGGLRLCGLSSGT